ncbi:glycosyltransferase family 4 protein [Patescibacteria group bacterium]|nr:glycosyltransferase family 4 protein [Patescibacteria group bacterium]
MGKKKKKKDDESRNAWYKICDIFIMPARNIKGDFEGFGIVYLEANLAGKPVIAGNSGGARDAVENGVNGLLVNPEDINEISNAIIKLAQDENLRKKLGEQGRERSIREFSWEKQAEKIYNCVTYK